MKFVKRIKQRSARSLYWHLLLLIVLAGILTGAPSALAVSPDIVISQVYGGGGLSGAAYTHDFFELFNRGTTAVSLSGWSVQYASSAGTTWQVTNLSGTIEPGRYFLIQQSQGSGGTIPLPTPDAAGVTAVGATSGKVALVRNATPLNSGCPLGGDVADFAGYGSTDCFEGAGAAPGLSNTTAASRAAGGCTDTDSNMADFAAGSPFPRNSANPGSPCGNSSPVVGTGTPASCTEAAFDTALAAVQSSGSGAVTFDCGGPATIIFTAQKNIVGEVTIDGGDQITLSGSNNTRLFLVGAATLHLKNIILSNGFSNTGDGGAIYNGGVLTLENTTIQNSVASQGNVGGAVAGYGQLTIRDSHLLGNSARDGGALYLEGQTARADISNTVFCNNRAVLAGQNTGYGGAVHTAGGAEATIEGGEICNNESARGAGFHNSASSSLFIFGGTVIHHNKDLEYDYGGGGISNSGFMIIEDAIIRDNAAASGGGAIFNEGTMTIVNSTLRDNTGDGLGGAIQQRLGNGTLERVTISGNNAGAGGAFFLIGGRMDMINTTIANNTAVDEGGAIYGSSNSDMDFKFVTIANNTARYGGGIARYGPATVRFYNTILANNGENGNCWIVDPKVTALPMSLGFNLSSDDDEDCNLTQPSDRTNIDPQLAPLGDYGGVTPIMLPLSGSPAVDNGQCPANIPTDQRGLPRPQGAACDIGAVEVQPGDGSTESVIYLPVIIK